MKTKYSSNSELAHIWANDPDSSVKKSANSTSCHNGKLYSYNTVIAQIVTNHKGLDTFQAGVETVVFNTGSYSVTTSKHQGLAHNAARHYSAIYISIPEWGLDSLVFNQSDFDQLIKERSEKEAAALLVKASRSRFNASRYYALALDIFENLAKYAAFFNLVYTSPDLSTIQAQAVEADKKQKELDKIKRAERIIEQAAALEQWRAGHDVRNNFELTALRIKNDEIETTRGARIPLDHAVKFWGLIKSWHEKGIQYVKDHHSIKLGYYTVNKFDGKTLTVGCHSIPYSEIEGIAAQLHLA
jgi:hypothetical protein